MCAVAPTAQRFADIVTAARAGIPVRRCNQYPESTPLERIMNKDQVKGRVKKAKGKVKKVAGKLVGSKGMEEQGKADETAGAVQAAYGDVKNNKQKKGHQPQL
jgi:uncharacterized protein YjbJ (UPF0337 family)